MEIVNVYQYKKYRNDKISQGLGDFIRGCFCLLQICLNFHIPFNLSITHPLHFLLEYKFCKTSEDIPHFDVLNYPSIDPTYINQLFHLLSKEIPFDSKKFMYNTSFFQIIVCIVLIFFLFGDFQKLRVNFKTFQSYFTKFKNNKSDKE